MLPLNLQASLWMGFILPVHFQGRHATGFAQGFPSTRVSKIHPQRRWFCLWSCRSQTQKWKTLASSPPHALKMRPVLNLVRRTKLRVKVYLNTIAKKLGLCPWHMLSMAASGLPQLSRHHHMSTKAWLQADTKFSSDLSGHYQARTARRIRSQMHC